MSGFDRLRRAFYGGYDGDFEYELNILEEKVKALRSGIMAAQETSETPQDHAYYERLMAETDPNAEREV